MYYSLILHIFSNKDKMGNYKEIKIQTYKRKNKVMKEIKSELISLHLGIRSVLGSVSYWFSNIRQVL